MGKAEHEGQAKGVGPIPYAVITVSDSRTEATDEAGPLVAGMLEKEMEGFGELFRAMSFQEIGPTAMLSRALLGLNQGRAIVCLPGSTAAIRLALSKLLIPELPHLLWVAT